MGCKLIVNNVCPYCELYVDMIADHILKQHPHEQNVEFVCTHSGRKQYFHTDCWNSMIAKQKEAHILKG